MREEADRFMEIKVMGFKRMDRVARLDLVLSPDQTPQWIKHGKQIRRRQVWIRGVQFEVHCII